MNKKNNDQQDHFAKTLIGMVIYSIILIIVVAATYFIIKGVYKKYEANVNSSAAIETQVEEPEEEPVEEVVEEESEEETTEEVIEAEDQEFTVSDFMPGDRHVDYSVGCFRVGNRAAINNIGWKDLTFSRFENVGDPEYASIDACEYTKKAAFMTDEKPITYEIYSNPDTGEVCKITFTEYCGDKLSIRDYYYYNGKLNYADQYDQLIKSPIDITGSKVQSRYYITADCLVKYSYCENNKATVYSLNEYDNYSDGTKEQYDYLEQDIINQGYITYYAAKTLSEEEKVSGYILDEFNQPLADCKITLYADSNNLQVATTSTNEDGYYSFETALSYDETYTLNVDKNTLDNVKVYNIKMTKGTTTYYIPTVYMSYSQNGTLYNNQILVRDAVDNTKAITEAVINYRFGLNNYSGNILASGVLDATGGIITPLKAGCYTAEIEKGGYENCFFNVIVKLDRQATIGFAVPDQADNQYTAILSWNTTPLDLDAKLIDTYGKSVIKSTTDSVGAIMSEAVSFNSTDGMAYNYYVSDFTECMAGDAFSYNMSNAGAVVDIYSSNGLAYSVNVPVAHAGVVWNVFNVRNGRIIIDNDYYTVIEPDTYWTSK